MITPADLPPPPNFDNLATWIGGLIALGIVIVGSAIQGVRIMMKIGKAIRETVPEEHATSIITADTVAMDRLAGTIEKGNELAGVTNTLLGQLVRVVEDLAREFREDRQEADINDKIRQQLAEQVDLFKKALRRPRQPRARKPP